MARSWRRHAGVDIGATQLKISASRLSDAGNYTVTVTPAATTGLATNSRSVTLRVFDAVGPASLFVPSLAIEGGNVSLSCSWSKGTETKVAWSKGGTDLSSDPRVNINAGSLIINPANRNDSGQYTCTVSNPVSTQSATAGLTVNYGPDTPQMTKTSSDCVGGGDSTVGQSVRLTCTCVSLPPALLSWQFNGQTLAGGQSTGGALSLQVFSTNQSGQYVCSASNSVTMKTSQQQISLSVVGTCLSVGAVAGIVVACFVALVLIIVAIVLILRQRRVDRRLRTVIRHQKQSLNNRPTSPAALQNGHDNPEFLEDQPDPPLHHVNRLDQNTTNIWHTGHGNNEPLRQNRPINNNIPQNNNIRPDNTDGNSNSYRHENSQSNPHGRPQQNPNILIQTGHGEQGTQTVLINLNTQPRQRNADAQPATVHVSLAAPQTPSGRPNENHNHQQSDPNTVQQLVVPRQENQNAQNAMQYEERSNRFQEQNHPQYLRNPTQGDHAGPAALRRTLEHVEHSDNVHNGYSHNRHTSPNHTRSQPVPNEVSNRSDASADLRQMPWDRMHGTPAYPNHQAEDSDSDESQTSSQDRSDSERASPGPNLRPRRSPVDGRIRNVSNPSRRDLLRQLAQGAAQRRYRTDQQSMTARQQNVGISQRTNAPQHQTAQTQTSTPTRFTTQAAPDHRQVTSNPVPLTQAALQQHTNQTSTPTRFTAQAAPDHRQVTSNPVPLTQAALQQHTNQTSTPTRFTAQAAPDHRQVTSNPVPLTQAALQQHTNQTSTPTRFTTQAAPDHRQVTSNPVPLTQAALQQHTNQTSTPTRFTAQAAPDHRQVTSNPVPLTQAALQQHTNQTSTPTRFTAQAAPDHRQVTSNPVPLTQAALQQHTSQTSNPLPNMTHQTQTALQHPGTQPIPSQTLPAKQINREGQAVPTPPPVLRPAEFRTLPREPLQQPRPLQTIQIMKRPTVGHHRPHNVHRRPRTMHANLHRHIENPHMHASAHKHPAHMNQPRDFL
ncbi:putative uncharacterized protein DDB_G0291608 [Trichomycterus rosablanca]|uniref:putative uncharacterized protein DDB_G0291608 n=1 Tax=Trichomycterus rosablanca TaxID=2290929 RepID=UPI002F35220B